jgi:hypothetical protein
VLGGDKSVGRRDRSNMRGASRNASGELRQIALGGWANPRQAGNRSTTCSKRFNAEFTTTQIVVCDRLGVNSSRCRTAAQGRPAGLLACSCFGSATKTLRR